MNSFQFLFFSEYGRLSREVANVISITQNSSMFGVFAGITIFSKNTFMDFIENNRATHFKSHIDAKDELTNRMNRTMFLGGVSWTWRCLAVGFVYSYVFFQVLNSVTFNVSSRERNNSSFFLNYPTIHRTLISFIPVIRNRNEWQEYVIGGGVGGTLAGYLFSDQKSLGFIEKKPSKRISYRQLSMLKGFSYGLLFGAGIGAWCCLVKKGNMESQLRQWEDYWKDRKTVS